MRYKQYSVVRLIRIKKRFSEEELSFGKRAPRVGDLATIVEVYEKPEIGYELECSDESGITDWLVTFSPEEAEFELIEDNT